MGLHWLPPLTGGKEILMSPSPLADGLARLRRPELFITSFLFLPRLLWTLWILFPWKHKLSRKFSRSYMIVVVVKTEEGIEQLWIEAHAEKKGGLNV